MLAVLIIHFVLISNFVLIHNFVLISNLLASNLLALIISPAQK